MFDFGWDAGELLNHQLAAEPGVATGSAGHDRHPAQRSDFFTRPWETVGPNHSGNRIDVLAYGLADGIRLLVNLFQHV